MSMKLLSRTARINLGGPGSGPRPGGVRTSIPELDKGRYDSENSATVSQHQDASNYHSEMADRAVEKGNSSASELHTNAMNAHTSAIAAHNSVPVWKGGKKGKEDYFAANKAANEAAVKAKSSSRLANSSFHPSDV